MYCNPSFCSGGGMVDTGDLKSPGLLPVKVRLLSRALFIFSFSLSFCVVIYYLHCMDHDGSCQIIGRSRSELVIIALELGACESPSNSCTRRPSAKLRCNDDGLTFVPFDDLTLQ